VPSVIAIDGTAASGKTTIGEALAKQLGYLYVDTGAMYRAVTLLALQRGIDPADESAVVAVAESVKIDVRQPSVEDGRPYSVFADGDDITWQIRDEAVETSVSQVSAYPGVRAALTRRQREVSSQGDVVMVGRDIGTVVLPEAELKLYFDANAEVRDRIDSGREHAPLRPAHDAVMVDTSDLTVDEVQALVTSLLTKPLPDNSG
jgi:cytidylate kinase